MRHGCSIAMLGRAALVAAAATAAAPDAATAAQSPLPADPPPAPDSLAAPAGSSAIDGTVTDGTGRALAGAVVTSEGHPASDLTTARGTFAVRGLPAGPRRFAVRRVGYLPVEFELDLPGHATVHLQVTLQPSPVMLGAIVVEGESRSLGLFRNGFYDRAARQPLGYFYPPEEMDRRQLSTLASLIGEIPGLQVERRGNDAIARGRGTGAGPCEMNLWVDGTLARVASAPLDQLAPAHLVRAVEVYPSAASVPAPYVRQNNLCGAIVVWTRGVAR